MTTTTDLLRLFEDLRRKLPVSPDGEIVLEPRDLVLPTVEIEAAEIVVLKRESYYDGTYTVWRIDRPTICLSVEASASFGLLLLAAVLSPNPISVDLRLTHPSTELRLIRVVSPAPAAVGLRTTQMQFSYVPSDPQRHPWEPEGAIAPWDYPSLCVMVDDKRSAHPETGVRDVLRGFGSAAGMSRLAQLFLDASRPTTRQAEFDLECEGGFRGVSPQSAELKIVLPSSEVWPPQIEMVANT